MEVILMLTYWHWWDKANNPYMEYDVYFTFKISFAFLHVSNIWLLQNNKADELMNEDTDFL